MARVVLEELGKDFVGPQGEIISAVRQINLTVEDGELLVIVGPSGSGKTTLLRLIAGLEHPTRGRVLLDGKIANDLTPQDRDIALVFQHHALYPHLTVRENLALGLRLRRRPNAEIEQRVAEAAALLGLTSLLERLPRALSGGERQRVAIGRAVVRRPRGFLFDEPLGLLDAPLRTQLRHEIAKLQRHVHTTLVYVTHDQGEALALGRRIAVINRGTIEQCAEPWELYQRPANLFVAGFIGSPGMNLLPGTLAGDGGELVFRDEAAGWTCRIHPARVAKLPPHLGRSVIMGLRPEHLMVSSPDAAPAEVGALSATVESVEATGPELILRLLAGGRTLLARVPADAGWTPGQVVSVALDTRAASFFDAASQQLVAGVGQ